MGDIKLQVIQDDVKEVTEIMKNNYIKVEEREGKLKDLEDRSEELLKKSDAFSKTTKTVKKQQQWRNRKLKILIAVIVVVVALVLVAVIAVICMNLTGANNVASSPSETRSSDGLATTKTSEAGYISPFWDIRLATESSGN